MLQLICFVLNIQFVEFFYLNLVNSTLIDVVVMVALSRGASITIASSVSRYWILSITWFMEVHEPKYFEQTKTEMKLNETNLNKLFLEEVQIKTIN